MLEIDHGVVVNNYKISVQCNLDLDLDKCIRFGPSVLKSNDNSNFI